MNRSRRKKNKTKTTVNAVSTGIVPQVRKLSVRTHLFVWKDNPGTRGAQEYKPLTITRKVVVPWLSCGNHPHTHIESMTSTREFHIDYTALK